MPTMNLTDAEAKQIADQRTQAERRKYLIAGFFAAADYLEALANTAAGGEGAAINPTTGKRWAENMFADAEHIRRRAAYLSANPKEVNV